MSEGWLAIERERERDLERPVIARFLYHVVFAFILRGISGH